MHNRGMARSARAVISGSLAMQIEEAVVAVVWTGHLHKDGRLKTGVPGLDYSLNLERRDQEGVAMWHAQAASTITGKMALDDWWKADTEAKHFAKTREFVEELVKLD